jgi:hypothetical protein
MLKRILRKLGLGQDSSASGQGPVMEFCEHGYRTSVSLRGGIFTDKLRDYCLLKKSFVLRNE